MIGLLTRFRRWALVGGLVLMALGAAWVIKHFHHVGMYSWEAMSVPFRVTAGEHVSGEFTSEIAVPYEIEIEVDWTLPDETLDRLIYINEGPAPLDIVWQVQRAGQSIANGDCRDYLYLSEGGHYLKSKLKEALLGVPFFKESSRGTISRGVGKVETEPGQTFQVSANVKATQDELNAANPRLVARINREFWTRHLDETQLQAYSGYVFLSLGLGVIFFSLLGFHLNRQRQV